jgi:cell shape-determining protein MreC
MATPKKRWLILLFSTILFLFFGVFWSLHLSSSFSRVTHSFSRTILIPIGTTFSKTANAIGSFFSTITEYPSINKELVELRVQNEKLHSEIAIRDAIQEENQRLSSLFRISQEYEKLLPCHILLRDPTNPMNFTINAGTHQDLLENSAIVSPIYVSSSKTRLQLIGRISRVGFYESDVLSLFDETSHISIRNVRNNTIGTLSFDNDLNQLFVKFYQSQDFQSGDVVVVSNYSSLPNNLIVGIVDRVEPSSSIHTIAIVKPSIDVHELTEVFAIQ